MADTLYAPPALAPGVLRIIPLGGLGEIGRNNGGGIGAGDDP